MVLKAWMSKNSLAIAIVAVLVACFALAFTFWLEFGKGGGRAPQNAYYYDPGTGQVFISSAGQHPPIETPTGELNGVRAQIFACGDCPGNLDGMSLREIEDAGAFVAYFEQYSTEAKAILEGYGGGENNGSISYEEFMSAAEGGLLIQRPGDTAWVNTFSTTASRILDTPTERCEGVGPPTPCRP